ncbi:D-Ala-D-Ala carboxypeptidase family metallohydrolase [Psychrobacter sp. I-STPA6b]|uniref:D-Ala-D-Ala carboxypeptidase family metallohydrolase n=1 Tax=Psychrobacter sp. I-STPA6b TaxID=2585718 RepID=UPI001D0C9161|nr:D-Ala-D-Ala carboxypeptidase family metallohydrolase [Psychrobacter sp. I-STPA6b]
MSQLSHHLSTLTISFAIFSGIVYGTIPAGMAEVSLRESSPKVVIRPSQSTVQPVPTRRVNYGTKDNLAGLISSKQQEFERSQNLDTRLVIDEQVRVSPQGGVSTGIIVNEMDFNRWLNAASGRRYQVARYRDYLASHLGNYNVPPMQQLLTTARSWQSCGYEPYQIPPEYLWHNMLQTLRLYSVLRQQGILPASTQIRSVYRPPDLNDCAGGSSGSKHMLNGAIDIWVPEYQYNEWQISNLQNNMCAFWAYQGEEYNFGLGLYPTGSIHIDTQGYRKWGASHSSSSSPCRFE